MSEKAETTETRDRPTKNGGIEIIRHKLDNVCLMSVDIENVKSYLAYLRKKLNWMFRNELVTQILKNFSL